MTRVLTSTFLVIAMTIAFAPQASAQGAIEIGGRTAITGNFSMISQDPDKGSSFTAAAIAGTVTRSTPDGIWEYGGGLAILAGENFTIVIPSGQGRYNFGLKGPEENLLPYLGFVVGIAFVEIDGSGPGTGSDVLGTFGPKGGVEYYFSSNIALQLEDIFVVDTKSGITNTITIGVKYIF